MAVCRWLWSGCSIYRETAVYWIGLQGLLHTSMYVTGFSYSTRSRGSCLAVHDWNRLGQMGAPRSRLLQTRNTCQSWTKEAPSVDPGNQLVHGLCRWLWGKTAVWRQPLDSCLQIGIMVASSGQSVWWIWLWNMEIKCQTNIHENIPTIRPSILAEGPGGGDHFGKNLC